MDKIFEIVKNVITYQNLTFMLGLIGTIGTLWTAFQSRKRIKIELLAIATRTDNFITAEMQFTNKSRLAVTVTDISIIVDNVYYPCYRDPYVVASHVHERHGMHQTKDYYTEKPPFQLAGLGGTSAYLAFEVPQEALLDLSTPVMFLISTNRGAAKKTKLSPRRKRNL